MDTNGFPKWTAKNVVADELFVKALLDEWEFFSVPGFTEGGSSYVAAPLMALLSAGVDPQLIARFLERYLWLCLDVDLTKLRVMPEQFAITASAAWAEHQAAG